MGHLFPIRALTGSAGVSSKENSVGTAYDTHIYTHRFFFICTFRFFCKPFIVGSNVEGDVKRGRKAMSYMALKPKTERERDTERDRERLCAHGRGYGISAPTMFCLLAPTKSECTPSSLCRAWLALVSPDVSVTQASSHCKSWEKAAPSLNLWSLSLLENWISVPSYPSP